MRGVTHPINSHLGHYRLDRRVYGGIEEDSFIASRCSGLAVPWQSQTQVSAHGLAAEESVDGARASLSLLHVSTLPDLGPHPCSCALPTASVQPSTRLGMDACVLSPPGTPSQLCCGVHRVRFLDAAIPQSLDDQTHDKGWRRRTRAEEGGSCRRSIPRSCMTTNHRVL
jgi:hypothetical protein